MAKRGNLQYIPESCDFIRVTEAEYTPEIPHFSIGKFIREVFNCIYTIHVVVLGYDTVVMW